MTLFIKHWCWSEYLIYRRGGDLWMLFLPTFFSLLPAWNLFCCEWKNALWLQYNASINFGMCAVHARVAIWKWLISVFALNEIYWISTGQTKSSVAWKRIAFLSPKYFLWVSCIFISIGPNHRFLPNKNICFYSGAFNPMSPIYFCILWLCSTSLNESILMISGRTKDDWALGCDRNSLISPRDSYVPGVDTQNGCCGRCDCTRRSNGAVCRVGHSHGQTEQKAAQFKSDYDGTLLPFRYENCNVLFSFPLLLIRKKKRILLNCLVPLHRRPRCRQWNWKNLKISEIKTPVVPMFRTNSAKMEKQNEHIVAGELTQPKDISISSKRNVDCWHNDRLNCRNIWRQENHGHEVGPFRKRNACLVSKIIRRGLRAYRCALHEREKGHKLHNFFLSLLSALAHLTAFVLQNFSYLFFCLLFNTEKQ